MGWPSWDQIIEILKVILSWPVAILIVIFLFRSQIQNVLNLVQGRRLDSAEVFGAKVKLARELDELQTQAAQLPEVSASNVVITPGTGSLEITGSKPSISDSESTDLVLKVLGEAAASPKAALMLLSAQIESDTRLLLEQLGLPNLRRNPQLVTLEILRKGENVPPDLVDSVRRFWRIRNEIVHGYDVDNDNILRAIDLGARILGAIKALRKDQPKADPE